MGSNIKIWLHQKDHFKHLNMAHFRTNPNRQIETEESTNLEDMLEDFRYEAMTSASTDLYYFMFLNLEIPITYTTLTHKECVRNVRDEYIKDYGARFGVSSVDTDLYGGTSPPGYHLERLSFFYPYYNVTTIMRKVEKEFEGNQTLREHYFEWIKGKAPEQEDGMSFLERITDGRDKLYKSELLMGYLIEQGIFLPSVISTLPLDE
jgi:hypothetical protein